MAKQVTDRAIPEPNTGCLLWEGYRNRDGYGQVRNSGKIWLAHRYAWTQARGVIPPGLLVLHRCDTPSCVNVDHLFLGTHTDNMRDMASKSRSGGHRFQKGHEAWQHREARLHAEAETFTKTK